MVKGGLIDHYIYISTRFLHRGKQQVKYIKGGGIIMKKEDRRINNMISRRNFLKTIGVGSLSVGLKGFNASSVFAATKGKEDDNMQPE